MGRAVAKRGRACRAGHRWGGTKRAGGAGACLVRRGMLETEASTGRTPLPTLFRFLIVLLVLGGIGLGAMVALATLVTPQPREMSETISPMRLQPQR